jgi:hypothetical protein
MTAFLRSYLVITLLSIFSVLVTLNWFFSGSPYRYFLSAYLEHRSENIEDVEVEFSGKQVFLNVHLRQPATCQKVVEELGINNIIVGQRVYKPNCTVESPTLVRVVYTRVADEV